MIKDVELSLIASYRIYNIPFNLSIINYEKITYTFSNNALF